MDGPVTVRVTPVYGDTLVHIKILDSETLGKAY